MGLWLRESHLRQECGWNHVSIVIFVCVVRASMVKMKCERKLDSTAIEYNKV